MGWAKQHRNAQGVLLHGQLLTLPKRIDITERTECYSPSGTGVNAKTQIFSTWWKWLTPLCSVVKPTESSTLIRPCSSATFHSLRETSSSWKGGKRNGFPGRWCCAEHDAVNMSARHLSETNIGVYILMTRGHVSSARWVSTLLRCQSRPYASILGNDVRLFHVVVHDSDLPCMTICNRVGRRRRHRSLMLPCMNRDLELLVTVEGRDEGGEQWHQVCTCASQ